MLKTTLPVLSLSHVRRALSLHEPERVRCEEGCRRASVALVLAGPKDDLSLCVIRRADVVGDPWSGHMALPGGRAEPWDRDAAATAARETFEEVGVALADGQRIGTLSEVPVRRGNVDLGMVLSGVVFDHGRELAPLAPNHEVAEAQWVPLRHLWDPGNATHRDLDRGGLVRIYPAIRIGEHAIWGLTFRVLTLFSDVLGHPLPHLEEPPD